MKAQTQQATVTAELIRKYDRPVPRYTSYPTALSFVEIAPADLLADNAEVADGRGPASLYIHLPFCESLCWFCGCTTVITTDHGRADDYLDLLELEMEMVARDHDRTTLEQVHLGGGSPTFLSPVQLRRLGGMIDRHFRRGENCVFGVEVDPRRLRREQIEALAEIGANRASLGVQDTDPRVQEAVHRIQPAAMTEQAMVWLREAGFGSVNMDLIYGLPLQTPESFARTLEQIVAWQPDRLALFSYAHVPWMKPAQKILEHRNELPAPDTKVALLLMAHAVLGEAGYEFIGLDHFALPGDELARAARAGKLKRDFQGYTTRGGGSLIGCGMSAISETPGAYRQNHKDIDAYAAAVRAGRRPVARGLVLTREDRMRRDLIMRIMCGMGLDTGDFDAAWGTDFRRDFVDELERLSGLEEDGLVLWRLDTLVIAPAGRLFLRNIAACFDVRLSAGAGRHAKAL